MSTKNTFEYVRAAYEKLRRGDSLTNHQMRALRDHFEVLKAHLAPLKDMSIVSRAVIMDLNMLDSNVLERERTSLRRVK